MGQIVVSTDIPAATEKVWNYCQDVENTPDWFPAIHSVRAVNDRTGLGAEYEFTARNAARTVSYRMRVTDWQEGKRVRQEIVPGSGKGLWSGLLESMSVTWDYAPHNSGTRLTVTQEMKLKGLADLLTQPWLLVFDRLIFRRALKRLAKIVREQP